MSPWTTATNNNNAMISPPQAPQWQWQWHCCCPHHHHCLTDATMSPLPWQHQGISTTIVSCHSPCLVTFFPKDNHRMAPMESPMMATSPLFSATLTTSHPHQTYIGPPLEIILYSDTTNNHHSYHCHYQPAPCAIYRSTTRVPPCSTHVPCRRPIISHMHQFSRSLLGQLQQRLSQDLAGDPKHIYKHKIRQESAPSRGS